MTERNTHARFDVVSLTLLVVASMIGVGIFTTSGYTLGAVASPAGVILCWVLGGIIALCGATAYGRLASLMPQSGGEYLYLSRTLHPLAGFLAGWISLTAGFSGAIATAAVAFEQYAMPDTLRPVGMPEDALAVTVVILFGLIHGLKPGFGKITQNVVVAVKIVALTTFLGIAASRIGIHDWHFSAVENSPTTIRQSATAIANSLVWISLSYAGFNAAIYVAGESREAARMVPRALLLGTAAVTVLYVLLNLVFVTATPTSAIVGQEPVAAIAANAIGGPNLERLIRIAVSLGLLSSISGMIMTGPRVYSQMASDNVFPTVFSIDRSGPRLAIGLQTGIAAGLILIQHFLVSTGLLESSLLGLFIYLGTTLSISSACCAATVFLPGVRKQLNSCSLAGDIACSVYVVATLVSVLVMALSHQVDGKSQGAWHLSGAVLTLVTGGIAWKVFRSYIAQNDRT
ncbi:MAG: amino acid permease [Fuerstiella sp.]|nr:amino acid permease [Fuerstiella sp.]